MKSDTAIRALVRQGAKRFLLQGKSDRVKFAYDGDKLFAMYEHDGQQAAYEVQVELLSARTAPLMEMGLLSE